MESLAEMGFLVAIGGDIRLSELVLVKPTPKVSRARHVLLLKKYFWKGFHKTDAKSKALKKDFWQGFYKTDAKSHTLMSVLRN